jgi:hypothetical protein
VCEIILSFAQWFLQYKGVYDVEFNVEVFLCGLKILSTEYKLTVPMAWIFFFLASLKAVTLKLNQI